MGRGDVAGAGVKALRTQSMRSIEAPNLRPRTRKERARFDNYC